MLLKHYESTSWGQVIFLSWNVKYEMERLPLNMIHIEILHGTSEIYKVYIMTIIVHILSGRPCRSTRQCFPEFRSELVDERQYYDGDDEHDDYRQYNG